eukprot:m.159208 g.159208  ORF g.159208 m.159208 type:complete len:380 (-) comp31126_c2_seq1:73-1212(-)
MVIRGIETTQYCPKGCFDFLSCFRLRFKRGYRVAPTLVVPDSQQQWGWYKYHNMGSGESKPLHHPEAIPFKRLIEEKEVKIRYKVSKSILGTGGFSKVKLAHQTKSTSTVGIDIEQLAVKITSNKDKEAQREVELLHFLGTACENICILKDFYPKSNELHMVFEYCPGGDIMDLVYDNERLSEPEAAIVARCIVSALNYCHSKNIAHRDIKGENVLCYRATEDTPLVCKLADFGCATYFEDYDQFFSQKIGSSCYMAPEVVKEKYVPAKADLWSLGVTIWTVLNGEPPFHGPTHDLTFQRVLEEEVILPVSITLGCSTACQNFIMQLMERRMWKRPTAQVLMNHPWLQDLKDSEYPHMEVPKSEDPKSIAADELLKMPT